jgi:hypothetical protein
MRGERQLRRRRKDAPVADVERSAMQGTNEAPALKPALGQARVRMRANIIERKDAITRMADHDLAAAYDAGAHSSLWQVREPHHSFEPRASQHHQKSAANASPLCDDCVVKKLHDFVTWTRYNFRDSISRGSVQAPVFPRCLGANIPSAQARASACRFSPDAWRVQLIGVCKTEIRAIDASTGKAVTNFLRPPETLNIRVN